MLSLISKDAVTTKHRSEGLFTGNIDQNQLGYLGSKALVGYFDGPLRFIDYLKREMSEPKNDRSSVKNEGGFNAFATYEEALDTFTNKPSTLLGFKESDVALRDGVNAGIGVEYDTQGDYVDVGRYLEGEPECFGVMVDGNPRGQRVNLILNGSWVCHTDPKAVIARSRRIQRLVDWLENQQVRTSILHVESHFIAHVEVMVKSHDEILDMRDVAVVSHPEFLRRLMFRFDEYSPTFSSGYGNSTQFGQYVRKNPPLPTLDSEITLFIGNQPDTAAIEREFDGAEKYLAHQITKAGTAPVDRFKIVCGWGDG